MSSNIFLNNELKEMFREYFEQISKKIAETISKSEQRQDNVAVEDYLTGKIIETINDLYEEELELQKKVKELTGLHLNIYAQKNENISESKIGADLGIILSISGDNIESKKAILVQAKKAKWNGDSISYPELKKRGKNQAAKMVKITPASFFFLYNPEEICKHDKYKILLQHHYFSSLGSSKITKAILDKIYEFSIDLALFYPHDLWEKIVSRCGVPLLPPFFLYPWFPFRKVCGWYAGIMVLPAIEINAIKKLTDTNLKNFLPICISFADFMVDYFLPCYVGDSRDSVIEKAGGKTEKKDKIITRGTLFIEVSKG